MDAQQRQNLEKLAQVIRDKIARDEGNRVLNTWIQPCGSRGCVLGDYILKHKMEQELDAEELYKVIYKGEDYRDLPAGGVLEFFKLVDHLTEKTMFKWEFGISRFFTVKYGLHGEADIIGAVSYGTLQERLAYIESELEIANAQS